MKRSIFGKLAKAAAWRKGGGARIETGRFESALRDAKAGIGRAFVKIGSGLEGLDTLTRGLREDCERLIDAAGGRGEGTEILRRAASALESPLRSLDDSMATRGRIYELMSDCERSAHGLLARQREIVETLQPLKFMLVFFKIEAAHLASEHRSTFNSVAEEILRLHALVDETFQVNILKLTQACEAISQSLERARAGRLQFAEAIKAKRAEVGASVNALDEQLRENLLKDSELDEAAEKFERAIGQLISSLQYEDILRQRCEAIERTLADGPQSMGEKAWLLLLSRQFGAAGRELRESSAAVESGLEAIVEQALELHEVATGMREFRHMTSSADGMVQMLLDAFDSIERVLGGNRSLSAEAKDAVAPVSQLARSVSGTVVEMSVNIQFIALNAQVRSVQVGAGSGLEVLAARTAEVSNELWKLGEETSRQISSLESTLSALAEAIGSDHESSSGLGQSLHEEGEGIVNELHGVRDRAFAALDRIGVAVEQARTQVGADLEALRGLPELSVRLETLSAELARRATSGPLSKRARKALEQEMAAQVAEARRTVHTRLDGPSEKNAAREDVWELPKERKSGEVAAGELELF